MRASTNPYGWMCPPTAWWCCWGREGTLSVCSSNCPQLRTATPSFIPSDHNDHHNAAANNNNNTDSNCNCNLNELCDAATLRHYDTTTLRHYDAALPNNNNNNNNNHHHHHESKQTQTNNNEQRPNRLTETTNTSIDRSPTVSRQSATAAG